MQAPNWTDFLNCSVCMSKYDCHSVIPVSLSCCHTICKRCLARLKTNTCPYDRTPIPVSMSSYPPNTSLLLLLGFGQSEWKHELASVPTEIIPDSESSGYSNACEAMEKLAVFLKPFIEQGVLQATASIPRPVLKKLVTLLNCQILDLEGRGKALRAAHSIAERVITELLIMHQNPQQIPALLWTAVRNRGCQFLGPIMQEEALRLILKVLESGSHLSRKNIVLYVVQQLQSDFPNASKTNIGHVVQLLYRASCFNVEKREDESSLMQLKEEYRTYESLRREHDAQIVKIAMEAGLRITPETWSTQLYGNNYRKSEMQSIIDKLVSQGVASSGLSELIVAIGRSQDPQGLSEKLVPHLDALLKIVQPAEKMLEDPLSPSNSAISAAAVFASASWGPFSKAIEELLVSLQAFTEFSQIHYKDRTDVHSQAPPGKYKTGICPYLTKPGGCPRGHLCPYAHSEEEKRKYINIAKTNRRPPMSIPGSTLPLSGNGSGMIGGKSPSSQQQMSLPPLPARSSMGSIGSHGLPVPVKQASDEIITGSPYSSLEESNGYGSFPGGTVVYQSDPRTTFIIPSGLNHLGGTAGTTANYHRSSSLDSGGYSVPPPPAGGTGTYPSYDPSHSTRTADGGRLTLDSTYSSKIENVPYYPSKPDAAETIPTSLPVSVAESWNFKKTGSLSSTEGGSPPTSAGMDGGQDMKDDYHISSAMERMKLSDKIQDQPPVDGDKSHHQQAPPLQQHSHQHNPHLVEKLHARIQHLEAELEVSRGIPNRRHMEQTAPPPPLPYQTSLPNYYGGSPHHSGEIMRGSNFSGPLPPPQYPQTQSASLPVDAGFYHPLYGGLPGHIPGHPWSGQMGPMVISPHTTPPNTQLLLTAPTQPPPLPNPIPQTPHPPSMIPQEHYSQIESDAMIAHFIQFAEQSKAQGYPIAPGAQLTPTPMVHQGPTAPHYHHGFHYRPQSQVIAGKHMYK